MSTFNRFLNIYVNYSFIIFKKIFGLIAFQKKEKETSPLKEKEEWYYRQDGKRIRYQFCSDCDYKTTKPIHLEKHVKTMHPLSKTALPPPLRQPALYHCTLCQYETHSKPYFDDHLMRHQKRYTHRCHLCSYSAKSSDIIDRHLKNHHPSKVYLIEFLY